MNLIERFTRAHFDSMEDFSKNLTINVPEDFNFGFDVCDELTDYGFTNLEKIIVPTGKIAEAEKNLICEENLPALKINALLKLDENLSVKITEKEKMNSKN